MKKDNDAKYWERTYGSIIPYINNFELTGRYSASISNVYYHFRYTVNTQCYTSKLLSYGSLSLDNKIEYIYNSNTSCTDVVVYYNANDPTEAILSPGIKIINIVISIISSIIILSSIVLMIKLNKKERAQQAGGANS